MAVSESVTMQGPSRYEWLYEYPRLIAVVAYCLGLVQYFLQRECKYLRNGVICVPKTNTHRHTFVSVFWRTTVIFSVYCSASPQSAPNQSFLTKALNIKHDFWANVKMPSLCLYVNQSKSLNGIFTRMETHTRTHTKLHEDGTQRTHSFYPRSFTWSAWQLFKAKDKNWTQALSLCETDWSR